MPMPANNVCVSVEVVRLIIGVSGQVAQSVTHCSLVQNNPWQRQGVPQRRQRDDYSPPQQNWFPSWGAVELRSASRRDGLFSTR